MRTIDLLIIHCADTSNGKSFNAKDIDDWHQERGFKRRDEARGKYRPHLESIGYHFVIGMTGAIEEGRDISEVGAHAKGYNTPSIGVCLIGRDKFTAEQWASLVNVISRFPGVRVVGHNEFDTRKTCPGFNVQDWLNSSMLPLQDHLFRVGS